MLNAALRWSVQGFLEAVPGVWGLPLARVTHDHDAVMDDPNSPVRFEVHHPTVRGGVWFRVVPAMILAGAVGLGIASLQGWSAVPSGVAGALLGHGLMMWKVRQETRHEVREGSDLLFDTIKQMDARYDELWQEREALRRALLTSRKLAGYLSSDLVDRIAEDPDLELGLGGSRVEAAVLFADIVGFTPRCEAMTPEAVVKELNLYFQHIDPCFAAHGGVIDKRMGDGVMAVFPPRAGQAPPGERAVYCGLAMQAAVDRCNAALVATHAAALRIRVGVASGPLVQGNMGSEARLEYTVIGDTVNLAARLEGQATPGSVLAATACVPAEGAFTRSEEREIRVKGKSESIRVVEVTPPGS